MKNQFGCAFLLFCNQIGKMEQFNVGFGKESVSKYCVPTVIHVVFVVYLFSNYVDTLKR